MENSSIQQVRDRLDIVEVIGGYIKLQKTGINFRAVCPFHSEKKPSFFVSPARQMFRCFGCGASGSIFDFVMKIEGVEFGDSLRILARKAGVELKSANPELTSKRQRFYEICELSCCFFQKQLKASSAGKRAKDYLKKRGINEESIEKWRLGYSPDSWQGLSDFLVGRGFQRKEIVEVGLAIESEKSKMPYDRFRGRIIFPIFDFNSQIIGFGGRITEDKKGEDATAKYINISNTLLYDKSRVLYGLNFAKVAIRKKSACILTEGYTDVILSHQSGFENTVSASGTSLTIWQLKILKRYSSNLFTAFDMDTAGDNATKKGIDLAQKEDFSVKVICMPQDTDPADVIAKNPDDWQKLIEKAKDIMDFYFDSAFNKFDKKSPDGKKEISRALLPQLKHIPDKILQAHWVQKLATAIKVGEEAVIEELKKITGRDTEDRGDSVREPAFAPAGASAGKSRSQLLEEKILCLVVAFPKTIELIKDSNFYLFSKQAKFILTTIKQAKINKKEEVVKIFKKLEQKDKELKEILDTASMVAEIFEEKEPEEEVLLCVRQIKELSLKKELSDISQDIKIAEQEGNNKEIEELSKKFNEIAKRLNIF